MAASGFINNFLEKVNEFLSKDFKTVLKKELHNTNRVNLYGVGEYWVSFEKSAYLLEQMTHEQSDPVVLNIKGYPFPVVMHTMHYKRINDMCCKHIIAKRGLEFLQFLTHPIDESSYIRWYRESVILDTENL